MNKTQKNRNYDISQRKILELKNIIKILQIELTVNLRGQRKNLKLLSKLKADKAQGLWTNLATTNKTTCYFSFTEIPFLGIYLEDNTTTIKNTYEWDYIL